MFIQLTGSNRIKKKRNDISSPFLLIASERERENGFVYLSSEELLFSTRDIYYCLSPNAPPPFSQDIYNRVSLLLAYSRSRSTKCHGL